MERYPTRTSWGNLIKEPQLIILAMGTEDGLSLMVNEEGTQYEPNGILLDINGVVVIPTLVMIPEISHEFPEVSGLNYRPRDSY